MYVNRASPFYLVNRKYFVVGLLIYDKETLKMKYGIPMYRRMQGDLSAFYRKMGHTITIHHVLDIIMSTLRMLKAMQSIHANHLDIKEDNILYKIDCAARIPPRRRLSAAMKQTGLCKVTFQLSDFGLVVFNGEERFDFAGTPVFMSPARYKVKGVKYSRYKDVFENSAIVIPFDPSKIWKSYDDAVVARAERSSRRLILEKSDLYALGIMIFAFEEEGGGSSSSLKPLFSFAKRLIFGHETKDLWTIDDALGAYRELRKTYASSNALVGVNGLV